MFEEHWATESFDPVTNIAVATPADYNKMVYPFTTLASERGEFTIGTAGLTGNTTSATSIQNVIEWSDNPLLKKGGGQTVTDRLPAHMPWEGPTMAFTAADAAKQATVSYVVTAFPQYMFSGFWGYNLIGGGVSMEVQVASQSINGI